MFARIQLVRAAVAALLLVFGLTVQACNSDGPLPPTAGSGSSLPIPQLAMDPATATLQIGQSMQFRVVGAGVESGVVFEWSSTDSSVAMVSADGLVTGVGLGSVRLAATRAGFQVSALVAVSGRPQLSHPPKRWMTPN